MFSSKTMSRKSLNLASSVLTSSKSFRFSSSNSHILSCNSLVTCNFDREDKVAVLRLNDPTRLNTLTEAMGDQLVKAVENLKKKEDLRAVVLTGEGKAFSAGGDLDWLLERHRCPHPRDNVATMSVFYRRFLKLRQIQVPVIGAINGAAIGAGLCLALGACDVRVAHTKARLGVTFVRLGLHPGMAATHFLPRIVGPAVAAELLLTGRVISAQEALQYGMVSKISDNPLDDALKLADEMCSAAPIAVKTCLETIRRGQEVTKNLEEAMHREAEAQSVTYPTQDFYEGVKALQEKREPKFHGQ